MEEKYFILFLKENLIDNRSFIKRQTSGTSSDKEWQRVVQGVAANDNEWCNEWQWVTTSGTASDNEWQRMLQRMARSGKTNESEWEWF